MAHIDVDIGVELYQPVQLSEFVPGSEGEVQVADCD
jgi:hypothetical protein